MFFGSGLKDIDNNKVTGLLFDNSIDISNFYLHYDVILNEISPIIFCQDGLT